MNRDEYRAHLATPHWRLMNLDVTKISAWIPLSAQLHRELVERNIGPIHGPPLPPALELRRRLGGHPAGPYQTAGTDR